MPSSKDIELAATTLGELIEDYSKLIGHDHPSAAKAVREKAVHCLKLLVDKASKDAAP